METLSKNDSPTLLSNIEVMEILSERIEARKKLEENGSTSRKKRAKQHPQLQHRDWIEENVLAYIKSTPCANVDIERMPQLVAALRRKKSDTNKEKKISPGLNEENEQDCFDLTEAETLQILNFMPQESVDIHLMIEDLHSRMSDERQEELLQLVGSHVRQTSETNDQKMQEIPDGTNGVVSMENGTLDEFKKRESQQQDYMEIISSGTSDDIVMKEEPP